MMRRRLLAVVTILLLVLVIPAVVDAAAVGRFTMVEGQVDLLHQGKLPAVPAKVQDGVEPGDVIRTKSKAKAQVKFVDDSIITMAPESRVAVADFVYDEARGYRRAVLRLFRGLVHSVVTKLLDVEEPGFITETHTAVMGVRGTESFTFNIPNRTFHYLIKGIMEVRHINPKIPGVVLLKAPPPVYTEIPPDQPVYLGRPVTPPMLEMLQKMMDTGVRDGALLGGIPPLVTGEEGRPEWTRPREQMTQPVIPPTLEPSHRTPAPPSGGSSMEK
jgi:hypothetical protein